jgi:hypothetical protein
MQAWKFIEMLLIPIKTKPKKHQNGWNWKHLHTLEINKVKISLLQQPKKCSPNFQWTQLNTKLNTKLKLPWVECKYDFHAPSSTFVKLSCRLLHFDLCIVETHGFKFQTLTIKIQKGWNNCFMYKSWKKILVYVVTLYMKKYPS